MLAQRPPRETGEAPWDQKEMPFTEHLRELRNRLLIAIATVGVIAVLPNLFLQIGNTGTVQNLPFGGTAVLIAIGVGLDTVKQIESQLMQRNYEGFLR